MMTKGIKYGNWIRKRPLIVLGLSALGLAVVSTLPIHVAIRIATGSLSLVLLVSFLYPLYAYYMFSPSGGDFQEKVYNLLTESLGRHSGGTMLDIGTGNGILTIKLAMTFPEAEVVGIDHWEKNWGYSKSVCEENAKIAGVWERVYFRQGDAARLDFDDSVFDAVVSNLTFHEVKAVQAKRDLVAEAVRVLRPGGTFSFVDMFYDRKHYGQPDEFEAFLQDLRLSWVEFKPLNRVMPIPKLLSHPRILGNAGIVFGRK